MKQHIQEINSQLYGTTNHLRYMVFMANQEQKTYTFKDIILQPDKSCLILAMMKEVQAHNTKITGH